MGYGFGNQYGDNRNDYGAYSYSDPFSGLAYGASDVNAGKFGIGNVDDTDTQWWSFMHNMWNHVQDSHRFYKQNTNSRNWNYPIKSGYDVTSNLAPASDLAGRPSLGQNAMEGLYGKTLYQFLTDKGISSADPKNSPWKVTDDNDSMDAGTTWGYAGYMGDSDIANYHTKMDSSWELGVPGLSGQENHRWFQGSASNGASGYGDDTARLSCFHCEVQYALKWDASAREFRQYRQGAAAAATSSELAWGQCTSSGSTGLCEYSSGVCFVEERRTFGYITLVRKGCKQAQACYMQKYQNFLVQAGRQCWPADGAGNSMKVASRPHDVMADQWIYNLVSGGNTYEKVVAGQWPDFMDIHYPQKVERDTKNIASTFDFKYNKFNDGDAFKYSRDEFDNTFVDVDRDGQVDTSVFHPGSSPPEFNEMREIHGPTYGFYKDPYAITQLPHDTSTPPTENSNYWGNGAAFSSSFPFIAHPATDITAASGTRTFTNPVPATDAAGNAIGGLTGRLNLYQQRFLQPHLPLAYANCMMFTSKCYQCCNSGFNCNANWQPSSERDWSFNDIRGHRYNEDKDSSTLLMRPILTETQVKLDDASKDFMEFLQKTT